jgi:hypothetical protein
LRVETAAGDIRRADIDDSQGVGLSATLGARYGIWENETWDTDVAAVLRLPATSGTEVDTGSEAAGLLLPSKPYGATFAGRVERAPSDWGQLSGQVQVGVLRWGNSSDVTHSGVSAAWTTQFASSGPFASGTRVVRTGVASWSVDEAEAWMDWPNGRSLSIGIGYYFDTGTHFDVSLARRREEREAFGSESSWFFGISAGIRY